MGETQKISVRINGEVVKKDLYQRQNGFDPQTGQPKMEYVVQNGFDPQTGTVRYEAVEKTGFDPQTGEAMYSIAGQNNYANNTTSQFKTGLEGKSVKLPANLTKILPIAGAVVGGIAVIAIIIAIISNVILGPSVKIANAFYKTVKEDSFGKTAVSMYELVENEELTENINISADGVEVNGSIGVDRSKGKLGADVEVSAKGIDEKVQIYYDKNMVQVAVPEIFDEIFEYDSTKSNDGMLSDLIEENTKGDIDDLNTLVSGLGEIMQGSSAYSKALRKEMLKAAKELEIKKISADSFEIDGKQRKCKGYEVTITKEFLKAVKSGLENAQEDAYGETYKKILKAIENLSGEEISELADYDFVDDAIDELKNVEIEVYLYKGKLAAIKSSDLGKLKIEFNGGSTRTSNMVVKAAGVTILERESEIKGKVEKGTISVMGEGEIEYSYDMSSGKVELDGLDDISLTLKANGSGAVISLEYDEEDVDFTIEIKKGSRIQKLQGDILDIGSMDEDDFEEYVEELQKEFSPF